MTRSMTTPLIGMLGKSRGLCAQTITGSGTWKDYTGAVGSVCLPGEPAVCAAGALTPTRRLATPSLPGQVEHVSAHAQP